MQDPYLILGVPRDAGDDAIHQAYLQALHRYPAERHPETFQAVRAAYELIRTRKARLEYALFNTDLPAPSDLLERLSQGRRRPGIDLFQDLLGSVPRKGQA